MSDGKYTQNVTLTVVVTNINDSPSIYVRTPLTIAEEMPIGTVVGGAFEVSDEDIEDSHTYTLSGHNIAFNNLNRSLNKMNII